MPSNKKLRTLKTGLIVCKFNADLSYARNAAAKTNAQKVVGTTRGN
jgi:hypothetical protein